MTLVVGLVSTAAVLTFVVTSVRADADARFAAATARVSDQITFGFDRYASRSIDASVIAFDRDRPISQQSWERALDLTTPADGLPGIAATALSLWVEADDVESFLERRRTVDPDFTFTPTPGAEGYAVIVVTHPLEPNRVSVGFDILTNPLAGAAVLDAAAARAPRLSEALSLVQDQGGQTGIVLYTPIFRSDAQISDGVAGDLFGWASGVFRGQALIDNLGAWPAGVRFVLSDEVNGELVEIGRHPAEHGPSDEVIRTTTREIQVFNQQWTLVAEGLPELVSDTDQAAPWITLLAGLVLTGLLTWLVGLTTSLRHRAEVKVGERTAALHRANAALEERNVELIEAARRAADANSALEMVNEELGEANEQLLGANEVKDDFLAIVSHEFRTPLTVIRGFASTILNSYGTAGLPDAVIDALHRIDRNARRLNSLVDDLLIAARIERGVMAPRPRQVEMSLMLSEAAEEFTTTGKLVRSAATRDLIAHADPGHLNRIIMNLLANASKYGAPPFELTGRRAADGSGAVEICVIDHGVGVEDDYRDALFDRFTQGDEGMTRKAQGVGIGLFISRELAVMNGGTLRYEHTPGGGATFVLKVPTVPPIGVPATTPTT